MGIINRRKKILNQELPPALRELEGKSSKEIMEIIEQKAKEHGTSLEEINKDIERRLNALPEQSRILKQMTSLDRDIYFDI